MTQRFQLQLQPTPGDAGRESAAAWFLPGTDPAMWLAEVVRCGLAKPQTRLYFVPRSAADPALLGVLIVPGAQDAPQHPPMGMPCRRIEGRLLVPLESRLVPGLIEGELARLCPHELAFLHPTAGLSGFEIRSGRAVWELLELPEERPEGWNRAVAGDPGLPAFAGIQFVVEPRPEEIFGNTSEAIGNQSPSALPPAPNEPTSHPVAQAGRKLRRSLAKRLGDLLDRLPKTASKPTWVDALKGWSHTQVALSESQLDRIRNQELHRLMDLLQRDPDAGLRHAIPINKDPGRGKAPPSARLGNRTPRFDASGLAGGPVDSWSVPDDVLKSLRQRYLELANQELQLGRYQRAAYIYANLLGDLSTAANVLKQGRHFREAALLYEHHLKNPNAAGECYVLASLHEEAIRVWTPLKLWERVADLHESLGQHEQALEAWRKAAAAKQSLGDVVGAARILDSKLDQPDTALSLLFSTWHASPKAFEPVTEAFQMLGSKGRHTEALERLEWIASSPRLVETDHRATDFLVALALGYPEPILRKRAANESLIQLARLLSRYTLDDPSPGKASEAVARLWPEDPILRRDCQRFLETAREKALLKQRQVTPTQRAIQKEFAFLARFALPDTAKWVSLATVGDGFQAVGANDTQVWAARGTWGGEIQSISWPRQSQQPKPRFFESFHPELFAFGVLGHPPFILNLFPNSARFATPCVAGTPPWLPEGTLAILRIEAGYKTLYVQGQSALLAEWTVSGGAGPRIELFDFADVAQEMFELPVQKLVAIDSGVAIGFGTHLWLERRGTLQHVRFSEPIVGMIATPAFTRPGLMVLHKQRGFLMWLGTTKSEEVVPDFEIRHGAFVAPNWLVLSSANEARCYTINAGSLTSRSGWKWESSDITAVSGTGSPNELAALDRSGHIYLYRL